VNNCGTSRGKLPARLLQPVSCGTVEADLLPASHYRSSVVNMVSHFEKIVQSLAGAWVAPLTRGFHIEKALSNKR